MQTSTSSIPTKNTVNITTECVDISVNERDFTNEGSTEIDINQGQAQIEVMTDGSVMFTVNDGCINQAIVTFDTLEDFIDAVLKMGDKA